MKYQEVLSKQLTGMLSSEEIINNSEINLDNYNNLILMYLKGCRDNQSKEMESETVKNEENLTQILQRKYVKIERILDAEFMKYAQEEALINMESIKKIEDSYNYDPANFIHSIINLPTYSAKKEFLDKEDIENYISVFCEYYGLDKKSIDHSITEYILDQMKNLLTSDYTSK